MAREDAKRESELRQERRSRLNYTHASIKRTSRSRVRRGLGVGEFRDEGNIFCGEMNRDIDSARIRWDRINTSFLDLLRENETIFVVETGTSRVEFVDKDR